MHLLCVQWDSRTRLEFVHVWGKDPRHDQIPVVRTVVRPTGHTGRFAQPKVLFVCDAGFGKSLCICVAASIQAGIACVVAPLQLLVADQHFKISSPPTRSCGRVDEVVVVVVGIAVVLPEKKLVQPELAQLHSAP